MILRNRIGQYNFHIGLTKVEDTEGVTSHIDNEYHILMWETDEPSLTEFRNQLLDIQATMNLPNIYIWNSSLNGGYHAYCFRRSTWRESVMYASMLPCVDMNWLKWSLMRGEHTLRVGTKHNNKPLFILVLESPTHETCSIDSLTKYVRYEILACK